MSGHQFSASNRDVDRNIREAKEFALDAFELGLGTTYLTPLQRGFYNRFKELESNPWASKEGSRSTSSSAQKQPCSNPRSLLNAKLGKLHTKLSPTCLRLVSRVRWQLRGNTSRDVLLVSSMPTSTGRHQMLSVLVWLYQQVFSNDATQWSIWNPLVSMPDSTWLHLFPVWSSPSLETWLHHLSPDDSILFHFLISFLS